MTVAVTPAGLRAPVSAVATSSCSASGAFSMSVAIVPAALSLPGVRAPPDDRVVYLIQPFSL